MWSPSPLKSGLPVLLSPLGAACCSFPNLDHAGDHKTEDSKSVTNPVNIRNHGDALPAKEMLHPDKLYTYQDALVRKGLFMRMTITAGIVHALALTLRTPTMHLNPV